MNTFRSFLGASLLLFASLSACSNTEPFIGGDGGTGGDGSSSGYDSYSGGPQRPVCPGKESEITGTVYAPNGKDPVPGATVFVPSIVPELFPQDVKCEVCGSLGTAYNFWTTTSRSDGTFTLSGVCPGEVNVVIQNGRFRRFVTVRVPESGSLQLAAEDSRLPRRVGEFRPFDAVPKIAIATGDYDKMECVLRKMGIENFDLYEGATDLASPAPARLPPFSVLVNDLARMKKYNVIFINCTANTHEDELKKPAVRQNIADYVKAGGRLYITDWSYDWVEQIETMSPFIDFEPSVSGDAPEAFNAAAIGEGGLQVDGVVKDAELSEWLKNFPNTVRNSGGNQVVPIEHFLNEWVIMHALHKDTKVWVEGKVRSLPNAPASINDMRPLTVTFKFENCGKVLFTSYHTAGREDQFEFDIFDPLNPIPIPMPYPQYCHDSETPAPQERILEFLIFDIASCVKPIG